MKSLINVPVPVEEFRSELYRLIDQSWVKLNAERVFEFLSGGPIIPFRGEIFGNEFTLKRNAIWYLRPSKCIKGVCFAKDSTTEVSYRFEKDIWQFIVLRLSMVPFVILFFGMLASGSIALVLFGFLVPIGGYYLIHLFDAYLAKKLEMTFLTEMNMMPHNYKSRFKK